MDIIVALDACFTQKRLKSTGGRGQPNRFPLHHPSTSFVHKDKVDEMENYVESIRPRKKGHENDVEDDDGNDAKVGNNKIPPSIVRQCHGSFTAADYCRKKADTQHYADTGVMVMVCRHDTPLFSVNMTSAGEKQHYALALIDRLFHEIPEHVHVGIMYDIGCQVHYSCEKWGFLSDYRDRIEWGISVFHAGGHNWACQLVYHPRKRKGFGLSDGEGCERFWWKLSPLIGNLRVQGFFARLYSLDSQMVKIVSDNWRDFGVWIARKCESAQTRLNRVDKEWEKIMQKHLDWTESLVWIQWEKQTESQTQPLKKVDKHLAHKVVLDLATLQERIRALNKEIGDLEEEVAHDSQMIVEESLAERDRLKNERDVMQGLFIRKRNALSVNNREAWKRLKDNRFLAKRMQALAWKQRLRDRLILWQFEIDALKRHESKSKKDATKLAENAVIHIKRREPTIKNSLNAYNKLCRELKEMITDRDGIPTGGVAPIEIKLENLWNLDVDSPIWLDVGLDEEGDSESLPLWMIDDDMRAAIRNRIEARRCLEEVSRLSREVGALQYWCKEEWLALQVGQMTDGNVDWIEGRVSSEATTFIEHCIGWRSQLKTVMSALSAQNKWGVPDNVMDQMEISMKGLQVGVEESEEIELEGDDDDDNDDEKEEYVQVALENREAAYD